MAPTTAPATAVPIGSQVGVDTALTPSVVADGATAQFLYTGPTVTCEDWRGVWTLSENPRTNACVQCRSLGSSPWINHYTPSYTPNYAAGMDGTANAAGLLTDSDASFPAGKMQEVTVPNDSSAWCVQVGVRKDLAAANSPSIVMNFRGGTTIAAAVKINPSTGVVTVSSGVPLAYPPQADLVNGYWHLWMAFANNGSGNTTLRVRLHPTDQNTVSETGSAVFDWVQIESGSVPTPRILTTTAAATVTDITTSNGLATLSPAPLQGAILRGVSSNASQQASLAAPAIVTDHAAISLPSATYPAGRIVYQTAGTPAGTLWQVNAAGTAWQTPALGVASLVGQLIAGQIAAGAINVSHLAADAIQSSDYTEDGYGDPFAGFRAGIGQVAPIKCGPLGLQIGRAKLREENLVVNRISNGIFYSSLAPWTARGTVTPTYTATSRVALTGGAQVIYSASIIQNSTVSFNVTGSLSQVIKAPDPINNRPAVLKVWYRATRADTGGNISDSRSYTGTISAHFTNLTTGAAESLAGSAACTIDGTWRQASITVTSSLPTAGDYLLRLALNITGTDTNSGGDFTPGQIQLALVVDEIDLPI